uniref:Uncharacterized protein n=1 Tax=Anguilla anguilla TaxID=7936 RepID=A0A0E9T647_ANGAN
MGKQKSFSPLNSPVEAFPVGQLSVCSVCVDWIGECE